MDATWAPVVQAVLVAVISAALTALTVLALQRPKLMATLEAQRAKDMDVLEARRRVGLAKSEDRLRRLQDEQIDELRADNAALRAELDLLRREHRAEIAGLRQRLEDADSNREELHELLSAANTRAEQAEAKAAQLAERVAGLEDEKQEKGDRINALEGRVTELEHLLTAHNIDLPPARLRVRPRREP